MFDKNVSFCDSSGSKTSSRSIWYHIQLLSGRFLVELTVLVVLSVEKKPFSQDLTRFFGSSSRFFDSIATWESSGRTARTANGLSNVFIEKR